MPSKSRARDPRCRSYSAAEVRRPLPRLIARTIERGFARFEKPRKPARPASPLSVYFVRPAVRPLAQLERACGFCGEQRRRMLTGTSGSRICETCLDQARGLLG